MRWQLGLVLGAVLVVAVLVTVPQIVPPRAASGQNACVGGLKYLQRTKLEWAARVKAGPQATPSPEDLFGPDWRGRFPWCPAGTTNTITIGRIGEKPTCSYGHQLK